MKATERAAARRRGAELRARRKEIIEKANVIKERIMAKARAKNAKKSVPSMKLEQALPILRRGKSIRRRGWQDGSKLINVDGRVFLVGPDYIRQSDVWAAPIAWKPYPECVLSNDWEVVK